MIVDKFTILGGLLHQKTLSLFFKFPFPPFFFFETENIYMQFRERVMSPIHFFFAIVKILEPKLDLSTDPISCATFIPVQQWSLQVACPDMILVESPSRLEQWTL